MTKLRIFAALLTVCAAVSAQDFKLGSKVDDFGVQDLNGNSATFAKLKGELTVVAFISVQCPVSNAYNERMNALYREFSRKGVRFIILNANQTEPADAVAAHAREHGFDFAVYKDAGNAVADRFGAMATPETYVIDRTGVVLYHGSVDDSQNPSGVHNQWLKQALDAALEGRPVEKAETRAFGCSIKRVKKAS